MPAPPPAPPKPSPPRPATASSTNPSTSRSNGTVRKFGSSSGVVATAAKTILYGPGGVGKTSLAARIADVGIVPQFVDVEEGSHNLNVARVDPTPESWDELLQVLRDDSLWANYQAIVIDSLTRAEELAVAWTLENVPHEKGHAVKSIEGYGFGKGTVHVYETFLQLLQELDRHARAGRHVIAICHDCTANVPNPAGEDWIRYEPRLQSPASGKSSIRHRVKEWADHLLYVGYDLIVNKEGKGQGSGTRTIYTQELPTWWAKSRTLADPIVYVDGDAELWKQLTKR